MRRPTYTIHSRRIPKAVWTGKEWAFPPFDYETTTQAAYATQGAALEALGLAEVDMMDPYITEAA